MTSIRDSKLGLAVIAARGGSVGLPGKNIRLLGRQPLIAWTVRAAIVSGCFERVIVSTDSDAIAKAAADAGADVPFLRPPHLASNEARSVDVVRHALEQVGPVEKFALLQPTSPFRSASHIRRAIVALESSGASSLVSVCAGKPLQWCYYLTEDMRMVRASPAPHIDRRQGAQKVFNPNGAIYICNSATFLAEDSLFLDDTIGFEMNRLDSIDIDDLADFDLASALVEQGLRVIDQ